MDKVFLLFRWVVHMQRVYECGGVYLMRKVVEERVDERVNVSLTKWSRAL